MITHVSSTIDEREVKIARIGVFDCHLSPVGRPMAIIKSVSNNFLPTFIDSINVMRGSRNFCQRGSNYDKVFCFCFF